jgi:hypothetical protein
MRRGVHMRLVLAPPQAAREPREAAGGIAEAGPPGEPGAAPEQPWFQSRAHVRAMK